MWVTALTVALDRKNNPNRGHSGFGAGSGSRAERIKNEDGSYAGSSRSGGGGGGGAYMKREDGGSVSSDSEDDVNLPRKDIDLIEISSDEEENKGTSAPTQRASRTALPVRIGRKEHQERTFGINTEASSETSAKILEQAESSGQSLAAAASDQASRKSKAKSKDVEITGSRKQFKGVWHDSEDSDVAVKTEPTSDDENMADAQRVGLPDAPAQPAEKQEPQSPDAERKPKIKRKSIAEPILQTDEDRAEWMRFQSNLRHIRAELGPEETPQPDGSGDVAMADAGSVEKKPTVRDNNVYLFQIPPLMPEVEPPSVKKEPSDALPVPPPVQGAGAGASKVDAKIKVEEGSFSDPAAKTKEGVRFGSGLVGKLRVHASGRTTLDWGGTSFELTPGNKVNFLQEVASIEVRPENQRAAPEDAGDAISLGRVKGKFVVVPNWDEMLG
jgi:DNA-directed RNA polymerase III subunit RPC4